MKKILIMMAVAVMCSCERIVLDENGEQIEDVVSDVYARKFTFMVKGDFLNPEFSTRGNAYMTADGNEMTDLWVVDYVKPSDDADGAVVQMLHQTNTDPDWGAPTMNLTLGTHHILFLASRGQETTYEDGVVMWGKPRDAFYKDYEVTVVKTSNGNRAVTLDRCATKVQVNIEDGIPQGTTTISVTPTVWYSGWNMLTGEPVLAPNDYNVVLSIPATWAGATGKSFAVWSLSATEEWLTNIAIESKAGEVVNASATISNVPLMANRTTVYRGCLYSNSSENNVSLNTTWLQDYEGVY